MPRRTDDCLFGDATKAAAGETTNKAASEAAANDRRTIFNEISSRGFLVFPVLPLEGSPLVAR